MHPVEVEQSLESMVCLVDTREQDTPRFRARLKQIGLPVERIAMNAGDYGTKVRLPGDKWFTVPVAIERKMSLDELCMCYCHGRSRFIREFERAQVAGVRMYLLVEGATWENVYAGKYRSKMQAQSLVASILAWLARYECQVIFCEPRTTGKLIHDILYREGKEALLRLGDSSG